MDHAAWIDRVVRWAEGDENVRVVALEGSLARDDDSVDELSDLDVRLYVDAPERLLGASAWFEQFGTVLAVEALANPGWYPTRLVCYVDGKIDFMIAPASSLTNRERFGRRVRVLVDKDRVTATIAQGSPVTATLPDEAAFDTCVNEFASAALMYARMLVRDDPIKAKFRDWDMKTRLFTMIEWDHVARYGAERDIRPRGARLRAWADADVVEQLDACWSAGLAPSLGALRSTVSLFRSASERVAGAMGFAGFAAEPVVAEIERIVAITP